LQNSIKHSNCKNVTVTLSNTKDLLNLTVIDDGKGFDVATKKSNGIGLNNMKKRAEMIGGTFVLESSANGTNLVCKMMMIALSK
jgi:signal transduction histidine kinase